MNVVSLLQNAFSSSDSCGKAIVFLLIFFSAIVWCLIFNHGLNCLNELRRCKAFLRRYAALKSGKLRISQELEKQSNDSAITRLCNLGINELVNVLNMQEQERYEMQSRGTIPRKLTSDEIDRISTTINNAMASQSQVLEGSMVWLGSLASIAPMLGLFGTVWGVMVTFIGIVVAGGRPDIQAIAPGISGALLTTVAGLVVAIPALVANNIIVYMVQKIDLTMDNFAQDFIACLKICKTNEATGMTNASQRTVSYQQSVEQPQVYQPMGRDTVVPPQPQMTQNTYRPTHAPQQPFQPSVPAAAPQQPFQPSAPTAPQQPFQPSAPAAPQQPFQPSAIRAQPSQAPATQISADATPYTQNSQQNYGAR